MHKFYFNECLPSNAVSLSQLASLLANTITEYDLLIKKNIGVERGIILEKETAKTVVCNSDLKNAILSISDKDREKRALAFAYFTKYPIQHHLQPDEIEDEILNEEYCFDDIDATNIALANHYNCFLFTVAVQANVKKNKLNIKGKTTEFDIDNLYGESLNTKYIESQICKINATSLNLFDRLMAELNNPIYTPSFEKAFLSAKDDIQESIIDMFVYAKERGLTTPYYPDTKIVDDVSPKNSNKRAKVYELRVYRPVALRIYFYEYENKVFIAKLGYKADYKDSTSQSRDIEKALKDIGYMIKTF